MDLINDEQVTVVYDGIGYKINTKAIVARFNAAKAGFDHEMSKATEAANALADNLGYNDDERKAVVEYVCGKAAALHEHDTDEYNGIVECVGEVKEDEPTVDGDLTSTQSDSPADGVVSVDMADVKPFEENPDYAAQQSTPYSIDR